MFTLGDSKRPPIDKSLLLRFVALCYPLKTSGKASEKQENVGDGVATIQPASGVSFLKYLHHA